MACHYHPDREGTDTCAICGKSICKECGLEIAGKIYCKECLEKIVGIGIDNSEPVAQEPVKTEPIVQEPIETEPATIDIVEENIYQPQEEYGQDIYSQVPEQETIGKVISDDSPYNIKENINYSGGLESSYIHETENIYEAPQQPVERQPEITQNEIDYYAEEILKQPVNEPQDYIYPDHNYEPTPTSARQELEDKYERYLDDLYFDENEVPLNEQLAKDEAQYGSLTRRPYQPKEEPQVTYNDVQKQAPKYETPEEMEARIRAEIAKEQAEDKKGDNIHNLNYKEEKEPMGVVDILLTIILIIVILIVIYYLIYLFLLNASYPTFLDALYALTNPQNVINNILTQS